MVTKGLSVRQTEKLASTGKKRTKAAAPSPAKPAIGDTSSADIVALENQLADLLGLKVRISFTPAGNGTIALDYSTLEQLDMVCQRLSGEGI